MQHFTGQYFPKPSTCHYSTWFFIMTRPSVCIVCCIIRTVPGMPLHDAVSVISRRVALRTWLWHSGFTISTSDSMLWFMSVSALSAKQPVCFCSHPTGFACDLERGPCAGNLVSSSETQGDQAQALKPKGLNPEPQTSNVKDINARRCAS